MAANDKYSDVHHLISKFDEMVRNRKEKTEQIRSDKPIGKHMVLQIREDGTVLYYEMGKYHEMYYCL